MGSSRHVPPETVQALLERGVPGCFVLDIRDRVGFDRAGYRIDMWSALFRPGSWEWNTDGGWAARLLLTNHDLEYYRDPEVPTRVLWRAVPNE